MDPRSGGKSVAECLDWKEEGNTALRQAGHRYIYITIDYRDKVKVFSVCISVVRVLRPLSIWLYFPWTEGVHFNSSGRFLEFGASHLAIGPA